MDNPTSPHLPPDIPADRCPACGEEYGHRLGPAMNDDGTEVGSGGAVMVTLGLVAFVVLIVLAIVALGGAP